MCSFLTIDSSSNHSLLIQRRIWFPVCCWSLTVRLCKWKGHTDSPTTRKKRLLTVCAKQHARTSLLFMESRRITLNRLVLHPSTMCVCLTIFHVCNTSSISISRWQSQRIAWPFVTQCNLQSSSWRNVCSTLPWRAFRRIGLCRTWTRLCGWERWWVWEFFNLKNRTRFGCSKNITTCWNWPTLTLTGEWMNFWVMDTI